jgi:alanine racemase
MSYNGLLTVYKDAIAENYKIIKNQVGKNIPVAVMLKANAYGLGIYNIFTILYKLGVRNFFVANLGEAFKVKQFVDKHDVRIFVLHDICEDNFSNFLDNDVFVPVLNTLNTIKLWEKVGKNKPCVIHFDSGINRLGLNYDEVVFLKDTFKNLNISYVMSHFASSKENDVYTEMQFNNFEKIKQFFPKGTLFSIANSGAVFKNKKYHQDLVRVGASLYGINPVKGKNPLKNAVEIKARVLQVKNINKGDCIGYNQTFQMNIDGKIAVIGMGYADTILRSHANKGCFYFNGIKLPIVGAVSMDLTTVDVTDAKDIKEGDFVEVLGKNQNLDAFGSSGGTSGYEILTSLSNRYVWEFK